MTASDRFLDHARRLGVTVEPTSFPAGTRTAADAATAIGCDVAQIVKSLVFVAQPGAAPSGDDWPLLALTSGANRVDAGVLAAAAEVATVRKASADEVRAATGYAIGGTPPFGHERTLPTFLDPELLSHETVWAAAGAPDTVFAIAAQRLQELTHAQVTDFTGQG